MNTTAAPAGDVIARACARDHRAFEQLHAKYRALVIGICARHLGAAYEDAEQITWCNAWMSIGLYDPARAGFETWIATIARNTCVSLHRKAARSRVQFPGVIPDIPHPDHLGHFLSQEDQDRLWNAICNLPVDIRESVILYSQGYTYSEIATRLGCPPGTARDRVLRSFSTLKSVMLLTA